MSVISYLLLISPLKVLHSIYTDSLSLQIFQSCSLSMISTWSHRGWWSPFSLHMWSATPDFSTSPHVTAFWCSWNFTLRGRSVSPLYFLPQLHSIAYTQSLVMFSSMGGLTRERYLRCHQAFECCPDVIWTTVFSLITPSHKAGRLFSECCSPPLPLVYARLQKSPESTKHRN